MRSYNEDHTIIALRGSEPEWLDWLSNILIIPRLINRRWRHSGFHYAALVWFREFQHLLDKDKNYVLTGHSRGAALATQLALIMSRRGYTVSEVVGFAEPNSLYTFKSPLSVEGIDATSYINDGDWINWFPPFGRPCKKRSRLSGPARGHSIDAYIESIKH